MQVEAERSDYFIFDLWQRIQPQSLMYSYSKKATRRSFIKIWDEIMTWYRRLSAGALHMQALCTLTSRTSDLHRKSLISMSGLQAKRFAST